MEEAKVWEILLLLIIVKVYHSLWVSVTRRIQSTADPPKQDIRASTRGNLGITFFISLVLLFPWAWKQWLYFAMTIHANLEGQGHMGSLSVFFKAVFHCTSVPDVWKCVCLDSWSLQKKRASGPYKTVNTMKIHIIYTLCWKNTKPTVVSTYRFFILSCLNVSDHETHFYVQNILFANQFSSDDFTYQLKLWLSKP